MRPLSSFDSLWLNHTSGWFKVLCYLGEGRDRFTVHCYSGAVLPDPVITTRKSQARDENVVGIFEPGLVAPCWHLFQLHLQADQASIQLIAPRQLTRTTRRRWRYTFHSKVGMLFSWHRRGFWVQGLVGKLNIPMVYPTIEEVLSYISFGWYIWLVYPTNWYILQILIWLVYPTIEEVLTAYSRE